MRKNIAYLVVLMGMLGCFAVVRLNPYGVIRQPGNLLLGALLFAGAVAVARQRRHSYAVGLAAALATVLGGVLSLRGYLGTALPGYPLIWIVAGLYLALRLSINQHVLSEKSAGE